MSNTHIKENMFLCTYVFKNNNKKICSYVLMSKSKRPYVLTRVL